MIEFHPAAVRGIVVEEQMVFTLADLSRASGADLDQLRVLVAEGLLDPAGQGPSDWRFSGVSLARARRLLSLAQDLELDLSAAALVLSLLTEIAALRARLRSR